MSGENGRLERAERILSEIHAATSEAAGVLKDLTHQIKKAEHELGTLYDSEILKAVAAAQKVIRDVVEEEATRATVILRDSLQKGCDRAADHIQKDFELAECISVITYRVVAELTALGYEFTQEHDE